MTCRTAVIGSIRDVKRSERKSVESLVEAASFLSQVADRNLFAQLHGLGRVRAPVDACNVAHQTAFSAGLAMAQSTDAMYGPPNVPNPIWVREVL
jgi:hypothetical protein